MSAFDDYCIVCEKLCSSQSAYCSDECKEKDTGSHYEFNNVPQLISPVLQPKANSIASTLSSSSSSTRLRTTTTTTSPSSSSSSSSSSSYSNIESDEEQEQEEDNHQEYLIKSPLLLSSTLKEQQHIAGLNLNDLVPRADDLVNLDEHHIQLLAASSNNYKKWLNVAK